MVTKQIDITDKLKTCGIKVKEPVVITETDSTYPVKADTWDNWFPFAYLSFKILSERGQGKKSFTSIGTGSGADAIGAHYILPNLERIIITDISNDVIEIARKNVESHALNRKVIGQCGNLAQPLRDVGITSDYIYANLPNIPSAGLIVQGYVTASMYDPNKVINEKMFDLIDRRLHQETKDYLQESQLALLLDAKDSINTGGSAIIALGGRVPLQLFYEMIEAAGFISGELVAGLKIQTEPDEVTHEFAAHENERIGFDFYRYNDAARYLQSLGLEPPFIECGKRLKALLRDYRISATEASKLYKHTAIGHTVHIMEARKPIT